MWTRRRRPPGYYDEPDAWVDDADDFYRWSHGEVDCDCGRGRYNPFDYSTCYECYRDRRAEYVDCILCGRWHDPDYPVCYRCSHQWPRGQRQARIEACRTRRLHIIERDRGRCQECGSPDDLQVDHIKPCAAGGDAWPWNLWLLCGRCNRDKGSEWWAGCRWDDVRTVMVSDYFLSLRPLLTVDERSALDLEVAVRRGRDWTPPRAGPEPVIDTTYYEAAYPELFR